MLISTVKIIFYDLKAQKAITVIRCSFLFKHSFMDLYCVALIVNQVIVG